MITGLLETCKDLPNPNSIVLIRQLAYTMVCHSKHAHGTYHVCASSRAITKRFDLLSSYQAKTDS